jgi:hypothetical protein
MLSGSVSSTAWQEIDLNTESSHVWAQEIQCSTNYSCSNISDANYPRPTGAPGVPWGGATIYHIMDKDSLGDHSERYLCTDLDFRNRSITVLDAYAQNVVTYLPLTSGSYKAPRNAESYPYLCWSHYGRHTFWSGTGSLGGAPPTLGTYLEFRTHADAVAPTTQGYLYVDVNAPHALKYRNESGGAQYYAFIVLVSDQFPYRLP